MKTDLTLLYSELGLRPDCSLAELQLAYRRRISQLHSDRMPAGMPPSPEQLATLRDLVSLYTTANRFHRRYGRLPGATPPRPRTLLSARMPSTRSPGSFGYRPAGEQPRAQSGLGVAVGLLALLFALLALASGEWMR